VSYPQTSLPVGQPAPVTRRVTNERAERGDMVLVHVGVPPGFDVDMGTLSGAIDAGLLSRVDQTGDGLDVYLYGIEGGAETAFDFSVVPRFRWTCRCPEASPTSTTIRPCVGMPSRPRRVE